MAPVYHLLYLHWSLDVIQLNFSPGQVEARDVLPPASLMCIGN